MLFRSGNLPCPSCAPPRKSYAARMATRNAEQELSPWRPHCLVTHTSEPSPRANRVDNDWRRRGDSFEVLGETGAQRGEYGLRGSSVLSASEEGDLEQTIHQLEARGADAHYPTLAQVQIDSHPTPLQSTTRSPPSAYPKLHLYRCGESDPSQLFERDRPPPPLLAFTTRTHGKSLQCRTRLGWEAGVRARYLGRSVSPAFSEARDANGHLPLPSPSQPSCLPAPRSHAHPTREPAYHQSPVPLTTPSAVHGALIRFVTDLLPPPDLAISPCEITALRLQYHRLLRLEWPPSPLNRPERRRPPVLTNSRIASVAAKRSLNPKP